MASSSFQGESAVKIAMKQGGRALLELVRDTRAVQRGVKATLTKGSERGHQPLPVSSLQGCTGANAGAALHGCGQQQGAAVGLMVSIPSFIAFWTMKCCTGVMGFIFSWFKDWYLWGEKWSVRDFPLWSVLSGHTAQWLEILFPADSSSW